MIINPTTRSEERIDASIFLTGTSSTDSVICTSPRGKSLTPTWVDESRLPSGYTEVEYIEATSAQYINLNTTPTLTEIVIKAYLTPPGQDGNSIYFCGTEGSEKYMFYISDQSHGNTAARANGKSGSSNIGWSIWNGLHTFTINTAFYLDGALKFNLSSSMSYSSGDFVIFAKKDGSTVSRYITGKLYSFVAKNGSTTVYNLVPCKNSSGVAGMYDLVNGVFYGSSTSTAFSAGPTVSVRKGWQIDCSTYGTYTIAASNGSSVVTKSVLVDTATEYEIEIDYTFYLYNEGDECTSRTGGWQFGYSMNRGSVVRTKEDSDIYMYAMNSTGSSYCYVLPMQQVDLTNYSTLYINTTIVQDRGGTGSGSGYAFVNISSLAISTSTDYRGAGGYSLNESFTSSGTQSFDISSISGSKTISIAADSYGKSCDLWINKVWLE